MTTLRTQLADKVGVVEEKSSAGGNRILDELHRQLQSLAPEVLAGDEVATAEAARLEGKIGEEERRVRLADLAALERAARDRAAAEAEAERQREAWRAEKADAEAAETAALLKFEKALTSLLDIAKDALEANADAWVAGEKLGTRGVRKLNMLVENRIIRRVQEELGPKYGIRPGIVIAREGVEPLAVPPRKKAGKSSEGE